MTAQEYSHPQLTHHLRRRGQALLLAVLVMVFAALIGATFITVVAINIGQTGREEERDKARQAAQAGLAFVNLQLTNSIWGTKWRPDSTVLGGVTAPTVTDPGYNIYWTPFDKAQGWNSAGFVKYPDPRSTNAGLNMPTYLVKVEKVALGDADNPTSNPSKTGALRITTIGQSTDDPTSFYRIVAYKAGPAQQPLTAAMRSVTNWDFDNETVPIAEVVSSGSSTSLTVTNRQGDWPSAPFYIMRGDPVNGGNTQGHLVTAASGNTLTLSALTPIAGSATTGERVEIAAALGTSLAVDYNNDGTVDPTNERVDFKLSQASTPGSTWVNGGLIWQGNAFTQNLRATSASTASLVPGWVRSSGLIDTQGTVSVEGTFDGSTSTNGTLVDSNDTANFPFSGGAGTTSQKLTLVEDGYNRLAGSQESQRQVKPFTPPSISQDSSGFGRYRLLSKYSAPLGGNPPQASAYGYGEGIYINNPQDRERVGAGATLREMNQAEMRDLWFSSAATASHLRLGTPAARNTNGFSLEQQHLRGWIGPDEFLPRGAFVQLNDNGTLTITLDPRSDGHTTATGDINPNEGPSPAKAWRSTDGTLLGNDDNDSVVEDFEGGVYTRTTIPWPANGVLFAEGNIRIRGTATNAPRSLTVVSMNNVYIEGSVGAGTTHRVLLLAKKNVVVNPTRVVQRVDAQTLVGADVTGSSTLSVYDGNSFQAGDWITIENGAATPPVALVTGVAGNVLTLNQLVTATANQAVRTVSDPVDSAGLPYVNYANRLDNFNQALLRRVDLPSGTANTRLAIRHSAERRDGMEVEYEASPDPAGNAWGVYRITRARLGNKIVGNVTDSIIQNTDKLFTIEHDHGTDDFPGTPPADETAAVAYDLTALANAIDTRTDTVTGGDGNPHNREWKYDATVQNTYDAPTPEAPYFSLSAVGNRYDFGAYDAAATPTYGSFEWRKNFFAEPYMVPMATSVAVSANGAEVASLRRTSSGTQEVYQFGFSSMHGVSDPTNPRSWEDVATVDQSFYNNGHKGDTAAGDNTYYTLDSRVLGANGGTNSFGFHFNPLVASYFSQATDAKLPFYRLSRLKLENLADVAGVNSADDLQTLSPGATFDINAYVYAQEGSWLIIPGDYYDANVRPTHVNLPHNGATSKETDENLDLNRDGIVTRGEQAAVYRFYRYNYQINFTGAIMENNTAIIADPDGAGTMYGMVSDWTDKWATVNINSTNWTGATATDTLQANLTTDAGNYKSITYNFDPTAANPAGTLDSDAGFHPPISSELIYQTG